MTDENNYLANNPTMKDDYLFSACDTDMTGLIPNGGHDDYELENYEDIYPYVPGGIDNPVTGVVQSPLLEAVRPTRLKMK